MVGFCTLMAMIMLMIDVNEIDQVRKVSCIRMSRTSVSLENRLTILPVGVVSKKTMGDLKMLFNMLPCSWFEALTMHSIASIPNVYKNNPNQEKEQKWKLFLKNRKPALILVNIKLLVLCYCWNICLYDSWKFMKHKQYIEIIIHS